MRFRAALAAGLVLFALACIWQPVAAQHAGAFMGSFDDPAIGYRTMPLDNIVVDVNRRLQDGSLHFAFDSSSGFLKSAIDALQLPVDSQLLVFSRTSLQAKRINDQNPRALYFSDRVAMGWVRGGDVLEVAAHDATAGIVFYTLDQRDDAGEPPQFKRAYICLGCHVAGDTLGVPGLLMFSTTRPEQSRPYSGIPQHIDQGAPLTQRFGGWFVTGSAGSVAHMGNNAPALDGRSSHELANTEGLFDANGYQAQTSDIVAHLVLTHQAGMTNLLTRAGWEARASDPLVAPASDPGSDPASRVTRERQASIDAVMAGVAGEVVDELLFIDEAKLAEPVHGGSGFAERFSSRGPRDRKGRSLYELDLNRRLMKYPCSYLIYSSAFDALPALVKEPIYRRMWQVLSGQERDARYTTALSLADRQAIVEILRDTKKDLPTYFQTVTR